MVRSPTTGLCNLQTEIDFGTSTDPCGLLEALLCVYRWKLTRVVLAQVQDGRKRVIAYKSYSLQPTKKNLHNYSSFKLDLLVLMWDFPSLPVQGIAVKSHKVYFPLLL